MLADVASIANYFGKSNYGTSHLTAERKVLNIAEGVKSTSDTRFYSSFTQVVSVKTCLPAMKNLIGRGVLLFNTAAVRLIFELSLEN
jgi:hypothetical protein